MLKSQIPSTGGLRQQCGIKVVLRLKPEKVEVAKLPFKVKDSKTIVVEEGTQAGETLQDRILRVFRFDEVFDVTTKNKLICDSITAGNVNQLFDGYDIAIIAYGQKNSGKTFTMFGDEQNEGIVDDIFKEIFRKVNEEAAKDTDFTLRLTVVEVFCETIRDLLVPFSESKALKLRGDPKKSSLYVKDLRNVFVTSFSELSSYLKQAKSNRDIAAASRNLSRSNVIIKMDMEQRDRPQEVVKCSSIQLVDLAGSEKLDKHNKLGIAADDIKKINLSMDTLENVARSLAGTKVTMKNGRPLSVNYHIPYKDSCLSQLLQEAIGGNCRTTVILTCCTDKAAQEETLNTLNFGANMKLVNNNIQQSKSGFNSKSMLELIIRNFNVKEENYLSRIRLLEDELTASKNDSRGQATDSQTRDLLAVENSKLKDQVDSLSQLLHNTNLKSDSNSSNDEEHSRMIQILMEKCEKVIQLQSKLDVESAHSSSLVSQLAFKASKDEALEAMNLRLLEQLQANEEELKEILACNFILKEDLEKWQNVANTRLEKIKGLESMPKESHVARNDQHLNRRSSGSSAGSIMVQVDEDSQPVRGSWLFGHSNSSTWTTRKVSVNSISSKGSQESLKTRNLKNGLNLHVIRLNEGAHDTETSQSQ